MYINYELAFRISTTYKNYHGYTNNCQNFVRYMLEYVCPEASAPETIKELVERLSKCFFWVCPSTPEITFKGIPGAYPRSSSGSNRRSSDRWSYLTSESTRTWHTARSR